MSDEGKLREQKQRAERAQRLLDDPLIKEFFQVVENTILDGWKNTAADDEKARTNAYLMFRLLQNLKQQFTRTIATGEAASKELLNMSDPSKIRRIIGGR